MTDRFIQFRENQRRVTRGLSYDMEKRRILVDMEEGETLPVTIDFAPLMAAGETLTATLIEASGLSVALSEASGVVTATLSGLSRRGDAELQASFSGGMVLRRYLRARSVKQQYFDDYGYTAYE